MDCLILPFFLSANILSTCPSGLYTELDRPNAFRETPFYRPLSTTFEIDTRAVLTDKEYFLSLDLWKAYSAGHQRPSTGIDLWSLMIGVNF
jgi:hypothetical protein